MSYPAAGNRLSDDSSSDGERIVPGHETQSSVIHLTRKRKAEPEPEDKMLQTQHNVSYAPAAKRMMMKMGFKDGQGLGRSNQGRKEPVEASTTRGRRGVGTVFPKGLEPGPVDWDFEEETIVIEEEIQWIRPLETVTRDMTELGVLRKGLKTGPKKLIIHDETNFIDASILVDILRAKTMLDNMEGQELMKARSRSNPFETIRKGIFINRAAMKMANLDAIMEFELTNPKTKDGASVLKSNELLYFADICAGPGGFSEYVLWKKNWLSKGFGFTLKGDCDFKLDNFISGPPESFEPYYGVKDDGDIFYPGNVKSFIDHVLENTDGFGVHFVMADGGFSVEGNENIQEILSKQLYLSQALVAMGIVRTGGHFVCKLFDIFTPFSAGLVYLMYLSFNSVSIVKPNTSRPANSERYLVCKWKKSSTGDVYEYLRECHEKMWSWSSAPGNKDDLDDDIIDLVPLQIITDETSDFFQYLKKSNDENGVRQVQNLRKICAFFRNDRLYELRQRDVREKCLAFWRIPKFVQSTNARLVERYQSYMFTAEEGQVLRRSNIAITFPSPLTWKFTILEGKQNKRNTGFYAGYGRTQVKRLEGSLWRPLLNEKFELSQDTLVYGEIVYELKGDQKCPAFHIIDGFVLGGRDITGEHFAERQALCTTFAKAMNKSTPGFATIRVKPFFRMDSMRSVLGSLTKQVVKGEGRWEKRVCPIDYNDHSSPFLQPSGLLFINVAQENPPWIVRISRTHNCEYWFNTKTNDSVFEVPSIAFTNSSHAIRTRINWWWDEHTNLHPTRSPSDRKEDPSDRLHAPDFLEHIPPT